LFITRRVVGVYGVGISLFFLPAGIFIGALSILIMPALWSAILIKSGDGSLKQSINKSAIELLALPIPTETKNQVKTFIDVFIDSFATGVGGIILIMLINGLNLSIHFVSISIMLLILLWFYYAKKVRIEYLSLFKEKLNLKLEPIKNSKASLDLNNLSVYQGLCNVLAHGSERQILFVLNHVDDIQNEKLFQYIKNLLNHDSNQILSLAIRKLYFYQTEDLSNHIKPFTRHDSQIIKVAAIEYLIGRSLVNKMQLIDQFLHDQDFTTSYAGLNALINEVKDNQKLQERFNLKDILRSKIKELESESDEYDRIQKRVLLLSAIGASNIPDYYGEIQKSLKSTDQEIKKAAIVAAGKTLDEIFIIPLLSELPLKNYKQVSLLALSEYGFVIINVFRQLIHQNKIDVLIVREIPAIVENIGDHGSVDFLFELLDYEDVAVRNEAIRSLTNIKITRPHIIFNNKKIIKHIFIEAMLFENTLSAMYVQQERMNMKAQDAYNEEFEARKSLITLLEKRLDDNLERIFKFLGLKYPPQEIETVYKGIKSEKMEIRMNSIEFLDNLLETNLKKILIPIIETSIAETVTEQTLKELRIKVMSQYDCFNVLLDGKDIKVKLAVLYLIKVLKDQKYLPLAERYQNHANIKVNTFAREAIDVLKSN
jgi:AAA family ATP:ADP antiporter